MNKQTQPNGKSILHSAFGVTTLYYVLAGLLWILFSDRLLARLTADPATFTRLQTIKGWLFVLVTALLLHIVLSRYTWRLQSSSRALSNSEHQLQETFEHAAVGLARLSLDGRYLHVNQYFCDFVGYSSEELLGRSFQELTPDQDLKTSFAIIGSVLAGDVENRVWEKRYVHKQGHIVYGAVTLSLARTLSGEPDYFVAIVEDTTRHRATERALHESQERLDQIVSSITDYIYVTRRGPGGEWTKLYLSPHTKELIGYPVERFIADWAFWPSLVHPDDRALADAQLERLGRGESGEIEYRMRHADGRLIWVRDSARVECHDQTGTCTVYGVVSDVTARKQAEIELQAQESLLQGVATATRALLTNHNFEQAMERALAILGQAARVDRVYLFQLHPHPLSGKPAASQRFEWASESVEAQINNPQLQNLDIEALGLMRWAETFDAGKPISSLVRDLPPSERVLLEPQKILSILGAPIRIEGKTWGFIGFDDCHEERVWSEHEESILVAVAATIGGAVQRERALAELQQSEGRNRAMLEATPDLMFRLTRDGVYLDSRIPGEGVDLAGRHLSDLMPPEVAAAALSAIQRALDTGEMQAVEYELPEPSGVHQYEARIVASGPDEALAIVRDVTRQRQAEAKIRHQAYHDPLTDLPNRLLFQDRLAQALPQARRRGSMVAVFYMDLDRFKIINDTLGHGVGDELLKAVAQRLATCVREGDTIARLGGDEFGLVLLDLEDAQASTKVAQKILNALAPLFSIGGHELYVTPSIGISVHPADGRDPEILTRNAELAMYRAKEQGRNAYQLYAPAMNATAVRRLTLENAMRRALERGEFQVYYQPQVHAVTGEIVGMEALLRWQHPELGFLTPNQWIGLAEETGLIVPIGEWVLRVACEQHRAWQAAGYSTLRVAVNLSARQFQQADLDQCIAEILLDTGLQPAFLELEITENTIMRDLDRTASHLRNLKELGVHLSIDDFGTGHSSLNYLKRFAVDTLKIDRSFVRDIHEDANDAAIVRAVVAMAQSLKLRVVAEGVETEAQLAFLRSLACNEMQGYLFSKPLPAEQATAFLAEGVRMQPSNIQNAN